MFGEGTADGLADVCENGFGVRLLAAQEAEAHADFGTLDFSEVEDEHPTFLIDADDAGLLEGTGDDIGAEFLALAEDRVKLSQRCFDAEAGSGVGDDGLTQVIGDGDGEVPGSGFELGNALFE